MEAERKEHSIVAEAINEANVISEKAVVSNGPHSRVAGQTDDGVSGERGARGKATAAAARGARAGSNETQVW